MMNFRLKLSNRRQSKSQSECHSRSDSTSRQDDKTIKQNTFQEINNPDIKRYLPSNDNDNNENNNNDDDFENEYSTTTIVEGDNSGRISGASYESAFEETNSLNDSRSSSQQTDQFSSSSSSGRSSSTSDSSSEQGDLSVTRDHDKYVFSIIERVRNLFLVNYEKSSPSVQKNNCKENKCESVNEYDELDLEALMKPLTHRNLECHLAFRLISRYIDLVSIRAASDQQQDESTQTQQTQIIEEFLISKDEDIKKAVDSLSEFLKFRLKFQLNHIKSDHFPKEFFQLNGIFTFGKDRNNIPVLYISAHVHRKWSTKLDLLFRRYVTWHMDRVTGSSLDSERSRPFAMCFDCNSIGYSNIDIDFLKFLVVILLNYYPMFCQYCLIKDNPWVFRSIWTLVKTWLPEEARNVVHLITAKQLTEFIDPDQIPNSMKVNDFGETGEEIKTNSGRFEFPINWDSMKDISGFSQELNMTQDEVRKFKNHVSKIEKEYLSLGAF